MCRVGNLRRILQEGVLAAPTHGLASACTELFADLACVTLLPGRWWDKDWVDSAARQKSQQARESARDQGRQEAIYAGPSGGGAY